MNEHRKQYRKKNTNRKRFGEPSSCKHKNKAVALRSKRFAGFKTIWT